MYQANCGRFAAHTKKEDYKNLKSAYRSLLSVLCSMETFKRHEASCFYQHRIKRADAHAPLGNIRVQYKPWVVHQRSSQWLSIISGGCYTAKFCTWLFVHNNCVCNKRILLYIQVDHKPRLHLRARSIYESFF